MKRITHKAMSLILYILVGLGLACHASQKKRKPDLWKNLPKIEADTLDQYKEKLDQRVIEAIMLLGKKHGVSENQICKTIQNINENKQIAARYLQESELPVIHDAVIPDYIMDLTMQILQENGLNPNAISIIDDPNWDNAGSSRPAEFQHILPQYYLDFDTMSTSQIINALNLIGKDQIDVYTQISSAEIALNINYLLRKKNSKVRKTIMHEVTHLLEGDGIIRRGCWDMLAAAPHRKSFESRRQELFGLENTYEMRANVAFAIKDPLIAQDLHDDYSRYCASIDEPEKMSDDYHPSCQSVLQELETIVNLHKKNQSY